MPDNFTAHYQNTYGNTLQLMLQDRGGKLRPLVMTGTEKGKGARVVTQFGAIEAQPVIGRFQPKGRVDAPASSRWLYPQDWDLNQLIDPLDTLRSLEDPQNAYVQLAASAFRRRQDKVIIQAALGTAMTGENGTDAVVFPGAQQIAADFGSTPGTDIGMTVPKLIEAHRLLMASEVDLEVETITVVVTSKQYHDMFGQAVFINKDYNGGDSPLNSGLVRNFMGFEIRVSEQLEKDADGNTRCFAFAKSALYLGIWMDLLTSINKRLDLQSEPWGIYNEMSLGATRLEEKKVVEIKCA